MHKRRRGQPAAIGPAREAPPPSSCTNSCVSTPGWPAAARRVRGAPLGRRLIHGPSPLPPGRRTLQPNMLPGTAAFDWARHYGRRVTPDPRITQIKTADISRTRNFFNSQCDKCRITWQPACSLEESAMPNLNVVRERYHIVRKHHIFFSPVLIITRQLYHIVVA